jgi:hypothetical protein
MHEGKAEKKEKNPEKKHKNTAHTPMSMSMRASVPSHGWQSRVSMDWPAPDHHHPLVLKTHPGNVCVKWS